MVFHCRIHFPRKKNFKSSHLRYAAKTYTQYQVVVKLLGSFRLSAGNRHLHRYCIFTERFSETVAQTLHYSTRRNLPDKELRYLRTVIVTADIHQGLHRAAKTSCDIFTNNGWPSGIGQVSPPIHPLASSQGAVFLINSCQAYFSCGSDLHRSKPYSEVTAAFLPSSLENSHSFALLYSSWLPVSVCGTDLTYISLETFLGGHLCFIP